MKNISPILKQFPELYSKWLLHYFVNHILKNREDFIED